MVLLEEGKTKRKQSKTKKKWRQSKDELGEVCLLSAISLPTIRLISVLFKIKVIQDTCKTGPHFLNNSYILRLSLHDSLLQDHLKNFFYLKVSFLSCHISSDAYDVLFYHLKHSGEPAFYHFLISKTTLCWFFSPLGSNINKTLEFL